MNNQLEELLSIHRGGSRGRIFQVLIEDMLKLLVLPYQPEPTFEHKEMNPWYLDFAAQHNLKLRTHGFYNPDFLLEDGTWLEISLSENTAYQKLFRYGHQAPRLRLIWLDEDDGRHKRICKNIRFPNAEVVNVNNYYPKLREKVEGKVLIEKFERLKRLKGILL
ncbi:MAG: hypothetical protein ONB44_02155 [candidate division KSB1 bacterium]|nr:hypothetical protein [candidate division KSB1 bacterium]